MQSTPSSKIWKLIFCHNILFLCLFIFYILFISCHLPNCMHPAHYISIIMHLAHSTLFQLSWHWWKCCSNELGAHKFYFCPHCQSWFLNMFLSVLIWMSCTAFGRAFLCTMLAINLVSLSLSLSLSSAQKNAHSYSDIGQRSSAQKQELTKIVTLIHYC